MIRQELTDYEASLRQQVVELRAAIGAIADIHRCHDPVDDRNAPGPSVAAHCPVCGEGWPCKTARIARKF